MRSRIVLCHYTGLWNLLARVHAVLVLCWLPVLRVVCSLVLCVGTRFVLVVGRRGVFFFGTEKPFRTHD